MNVNVLIDAIVRQNMVLIAQLATAAGMRSPLAHVANQVFLDLANELHAQGLSQKVIADMFGLALRTYHAKVRRLSESATDRGRSLWEAVLSYLQDDGGLVFRADVLLRFNRDNAMTVKGVLNDLVETGLILRTGRGDRTAYRAASPEELGRTEDLDPVEGAASMAWVAIHRNAPATRETLEQFVALTGDDLDLALARLASDGRIQTHTDDDGTTVYTSDECVIPYGNAVGWEAAVFDHYQALVAAVCTKLRQGRNRALPRDAVGGSTYGYDLWQGHPMEDEVLAFLSTVRTQASELRQRVDAYNATDPEAQTADPVRVVFYAGQNVLMHDNDLDTSK